MDINQAIDALLTHTYKDKTEFYQVSTYLASQGFDYSYSDSYILSGKLKELDLFDMVSVSTEEAGADCMIYANSKGHDFVEEYQAYTNYLSGLRKAKSAAMANAPSPNERKQSPMVKLIDIIIKWWWLILLPIIIGVVILCIEYKSGYFIEQSPKLPLH